MGAIKNKLISDFLKTPIKIGDQVAVRGLGRQDKSAMGNSASITDLLSNEDGSTSVTIIEHGSPRIINPVDYERITSHIGASTFIIPEQRIRVLNFDLSGIISYLGLDDRPREKYTIGDHDVEFVNWNPYVVNEDGNREYYQRNFVWSLQDKQNLIESLYNYIDCGKILIRKRSWDELRNSIDMGHKDVAFMDIVDGKQRLNTIHEFMKDVFPDSHGNYYSDLSDKSQRILTNTQLITVSIIDEDAPDSLIIDQFLKLNFTGVLQSSEHLEYVKSINNRM